MRSDLLKEMHDSHSDGMIPAFCRMGNDADRLRQGVNK